MALLNIQDDLAATKDLVGCLHLACQSLQAPKDRAALSAVSYAIREKLETIDEALRDIIGSADVDAGWGSDSK